MVNKSQPRGQFARGLRMGKLGLSLTGSYFGYQFQNLVLDGGGKEERRKTFEQKASKQVREELQTLKGAVMKIGQALSMQSHAFSPEITEELANLQMKAPAMHPTLARAQFKASFGNFPEDVFRAFEPEPFAAASLGQAHRAVTREGRRVVVKIQYPAIRTAIENDFKLLRSAALPGKLTGHVKEDMLKEMERGILRETDYLEEARNLKLFKEKLRCLPFVSVPESFPALSTDKILTMTEMDGTHLDEWLAANPSQKLRNTLGVHLAELFHFQLRRLHAIHADPHPGNYLFKRDGSISLVDFGSVSHFSPNMMGIIRCFTDRVWEKGESERIRMTRIICGAKVDVNARGTRETIQQTLEFYNKVFPGGVVHFGDSSLILSLTSLWKQFVRQKFTNAELIFASRAELGLYNMLHRLNADVDTTELLHRVAAMKAAA